MVISVDLLNENPTTYRRFSLLNEPQKYFFRKLFSRATEAKAPIFLRLRVARLKVVP